jgi:hypothetical protein
MSNFRRPRERGLTALVITQAVLLFLFVPLLAEPWIPHFAAAVLLLVVIGIMLAIVLTIVWRNRLAAWGILSATALEMLAIALRILHPSKLTESLDFVAALLFFFALTAVLGMVVFATGRVTIHRILGAVAIYLNVAFAFALGYRLIAALAPAAFSGRLTPANDPQLFDYVYFSLSTLTTSGYGDIVPSAPLARSLANLEAVIGQLFPATLLARLVMLELESSRNSAQDAGRQHSPNDSPVEPMVE